MYRLWNTSNMEQQQQLVVEAARTNVPTEVDNIDGQIIIHILYQIGWIDITRPGLVFDFKHFTGYRINNDGRVICLDLGLGAYTTQIPDGTLEWIDPRPDLSQLLWVLPNLISELRMLQKLYLWKCRSLPDSMNLPKLITLTLYDCDEVIMNIKGTSLIKLPRLRCLYLIEFKLTEENNTSSLITFMKQLPSLSELGFAGDAKDKNGHHRSCVPFLELLKNDHCTFLRNKLNCIVIEGFVMKKYDVVSFFNDVLPNYPKIYSITLQNNLIETLQGVGDLIVNPSSNTRRNLTRILINDNPVADRLINNDANERKAVLNILKKFDRVSRIGEEFIDDAWCPINLDRYGPDIDYALRMNHAGRILIENVPLPTATTTLAAAASATTKTHADAAPAADPVARNVKTFGISTEGHDNDGRIVCCPYGPYDGSTIPLSVWPVVLERAAAAQPRTKQLRGSNLHTGLFYLVRTNVPFFEYIATLRGNQFMMPPRKKRRTTTTIDINIDAFN